MLTAEMSLETEAHLWIARPGEIRDPDLVLAYDALLTADERAKVSRYRFEKDRHASLVTRALVRTVLSRYAAVSPGGWRFVANEFGRPEIQEPREERSLRFNLSHTEGLVVCLVSRDREVGVDVEDRTRGGDLLDIADRFFSPFEVKALRALPPEEQMDRFFLYWTLKESYIKARGMGLALSLSAFSFDLDSPGSGIRILLEPSLDDDPGRWQFSALSYGRRHTIALGMELKREREVKIVVR
ncbi:MAG: 4'-phosphopantetheinyl transferase family protein, partial [Vicinamibacteria bacterium]